MPLLRRALLLSSLLLVASVGTTGCGEPEETAASCPDDCQISPPAICGGDVSTVFSLGQCVDGRCQFTETNTDCAATGRLCENGRCQTPPDPCAGIACASPPAAFCDELTAVTYAGEGACTDGLCDYSENRQDCAARGLICRDGRCTQPIDLCVDVSCDAPPEDTCDEEEAVRYARTGTCTDGECSYEESSRLDCADGGGFCFEGRCQQEDPCAAVDCTTPPAPVCDGETAVVSSGGRCVRGVCSFTETRTDCEDAGQVCRTGACVDRDPCEGVVCDRPPVPRCDGTVVREYSNPGTCVAGTCTYDELTTDCADADLICIDAECAPVDTCVPSACTRPPANRCEGDSSYTYSLPGICADGACSYVETITDCTDDGLTCIGGICDLPDDPCAGVSCTTPPASTCAGNQLLVSSEDGVCEDGACSYGSSFVDCTIGGGTCEVDRCVPPDLCVGVVCDELEAFCDDNTLVERTETGVCDAGLCDYADEIRTDCGIAGRVCINGACRGAGALLTASELLVTEVALLDDPTSSWIELYSPFGELDLSGLVLEIGDATFTVPTGFEVTNDDPYLVIGASGAAASGNADLVLPTLGAALRQEDARVTLQGSEVVFVTPVATTLGGDASATGQLDRGWSDRSFEDAMAWCTSPVAGGSPGAISPPCPSRIGRFSLLLTEQYRATDDVWIELHNPTASEVNALGLTLAFAGREHVIEQDLQIAAGAYAVIGATDGAAQGRVSLVLPVLNDLLDGAPGVVVLQTPSGVVFTGPLPTADAYQVDASDLTPSTVEDSANWCETPDGGGYRGTPGLSNVSCTP